MQKQYLVPAGDSNKLFELKAKVGDFAARNKKPLLVTGGVGLALLIYMKLKK